VLILGAKPGESVYIENSTAKQIPAPQLNDKKFKKAIVLFKTDDNCVATYNGLRLRTEAGFLSVNSLKNCPIS
jgi:hypothetical protein